jgi:hypothetical protein
MNKVPLKTLILEWVIVLVVAVGLALLLNGVP